MSSPTPKLVETPHYHIWTDALHGRALAQQTANRWDRGTYVRWTVITAWTALEMACEDALAKQGIGHRFKENLDQALATAGLPPIDWGRGLWQRVEKIHRFRKACVHGYPTDQELFAEVALADDAITTLREAIYDIYSRTGKAAPAWGLDDHDRGWDGPAGDRDVAHLTAARQGADERDPEVIRVAYVHKDREYVSDVLPAGSDPAPYVDHILATMLSPISAVRIYRGSTLVSERELPMRGV
jgi:hypothetical protein